MYSKQETRTHGCDQWLQVGETPPPYGHIIYYYCMSFKHLHVYSDSYKDTEYEAVALFSSFLFSKLFFSHYLNFFFNSWDFSEQHKNADLSNLPVNNLKIVLFLLKLFCNNSYDFLFPSVFLSFYSDLE